MKSKFESQLAYSGLLFAFEWIVVAVPDLRPFLGSGGNTYRGFKVAAHPQPQRCRVMRARMNEIVVGSTSVLPGEVVLFCLVSQVDSTL